MTRLDLKDLPRERGVRYVKRGGRILAFRGDDQQSPAVAEALRTSAREPSELERRVELAVKRWGHLGPAPADVWRARVADIEREERAQADIARQEARTARERAAHEARQAELQHFWRLQYG